MPNGALSMPRLEFWYEFASPYSYLSAMRIEELAAKSGVSIDWKPFLLGPIFRAQGMNDTPFRLYPKRGQYMVRDMERLCTARGLPFKPSPLFPQNGLRAARLALVGTEEGWTPGFTCEIFLRQFRDQADISGDVVLIEALRVVGQDADDLIANIDTPPVKDALRTQTETAAALGIFGAPTFVTADGELFWGDDRLEQALGWAAQGGAPEASGRKY
jgi:2-hydroxychromene-2-carboxylate isomerase